MAIQIQRRRGTKAENDTFTGAVGEFLYLTDDKNITIHDGSTLGGITIPSELDIIDDKFGYATSTGTDTIVLTIESGISAYSAGQQFSFKAGATITGSATLNVNTLGAKTIKKKDVSSGTVIALEAGDIISGGVYTVRYDGTDLQLIANDGGAGGAMVLLGTATASTSATIDFTSLIDSTYDDYLIRFSGVTTDATLTIATIKVSTDNGSTWLASNIGHISKIHLADGTKIESDVNLTSVIYIIGVSSARMGTGSDIALSGEFTLSNVNGTTDKAIDGKAVYESASNGFASSKFQGYIRNTSNINAVQIVNNTGNFSVGEFYIYGIVKS